ncbi:response regulator [Desulfobacterota bacterium AH_259_B03_O07]|nr:response regulator [Desulfobacterota bacterium AH_259_B03_O07]
MEDKEKILIVDDEEILTDLLTEIIAEMGYQCEIARNGIECLEKFERGQYFDIVLLDIQMPMLNGIETLTKLKTFGLDITIIMVTASRDFEDAKVALKEGAYDYIVKPFKNIEVMTVIKRAVERSRLIKEVKDYQENLEKKVLKQTNQLVSLYADTLEAMVLALDLRECETGYHSYRVTKYALILAKKMGVADSDLAVIAKGALLHDIGKIGIPDNILLKPEKLTEQEMEIMRRHPYYGYKLLKKIKFLEQEAEIVVSHHENYDGTGYPEKISGKEIPLGARIFSIVDTLDAMTTSRSYSQAISFEEAIELINQASARQFDPEVIKAFIKIPKEKWIKARNSIEKADFDYLKNLLYSLNES